MKMSDKDARKWFKWKAECSKLSGQHSTEKKVGWEGGKGDDQMSWDVLIYQCVVVVCCGPISSHHRACGGTMLTHVHRSRVSQYLPALQELLVYLLTFTLELPHP